MTERATLDLLESLRRVEHVCLAAELRTANRIVTKFYAEQISKSGISAPQFSLLLRLHFLREPTMIALAESLETDRTTMARNVGLLEKGGYVEVCQGEDKRARIVRMTEAGFDALLEALPLWVEAQEQMRKQIGDALWGDMLRDCRTLIDTVKSG